MANANINNPGSRANSPSPSRPASPTGSQASFHSQAQNFNVSVGHTVPPMYPHYPLGMIANTVESYNGETNPRHYFEQIEERQLLDGWTEDTTLRIIKYRLRGSAQKFIKSDPELKTLDYAEFKKRVIKQFTKTRNPGEAMRQLQSCYQKHDEQVSKFATRIRTLGLEVLMEDLKIATPGQIEGMRAKSKQLIVTQFQQGLKRELQDKVGIILMRTENLTLNEAEEIAKCQETNESMMRRNVNPILATQANPEYQGRRETPRHGRNPQNQYPLADYRHNARQNRPNHPPDPRNSNTNPNRQSNEPSNYWQRNQENYASRYENNSRNNQNSGYNNPPFYPRDQGRNQSYNRNYAANKGNYDSYRNKQEQTDYRSRDSAPRNFPFRPREERPREENVQNSQRDSSHLNSNDAAIAPHIVVQAPKKSQ